MGTLNHFLHIEVRLGQLTFAVHDDVSSGRDHGGLDEPGQSEADEDVEHVAADGIRHGHVAVA